MTSRESVFYDGREIVLLRISNASGAYTELTNLGASVVSVVVPDKNGVLSNVVLRYDRLNDYFTDKFYMGSTIGRFSNRVSNARFVMDGMVYTLDKNDSENSNHGGYNGLNKKLFSYQISDGSVTFYTESPDGEGGFPGNLKIRVTYSFSENNDLRIEYSASSNKRTPVSFTNHAYFNLSGKKNSILTHQLKINAEKYMETDSRFLPTGRILPVRDTPFDFGEYRTIHDMSSLKKDSMEGYNAYFISKSSKKALASVKDVTSGRIADIYSNMPGILFYTGDFLSDQFLSFQGLCLEAQYYPDAMNHAGFEGNILEADKENTDVIVYSFKTEG